MLVTVATKSMSAIGMGNFLYKSHTKLRAVRCLPFLDFQYTILSKFRLRMELGKIANVLSMIAKPSQYSLHDGQGDMGTSCLDRLYINGVSG